MSTRSQTILKYGGDTVCKFYRHCDGYPEGHGLELCRAVGKEPNPMGILNLMMFFDIELEAVTAEHGDIEYLYEVDMPAPYGYYPDGRPEPIVRVYDVWKRETIFEGTPKDVKWEILGVQ